MTTSFRVRYFSDINTPSSPIWNAGFIRGYEITPAPPYANNSIITFNSALNVWTVTAGGGGSDATSIQGTPISTDAIVPTVQNGQFLVYDSSVLPSGEWGVQPTTPPTNGQILVYNSTSGEWEAQTSVSGDATSLRGVTIETGASTPSANNTLIYNSTSGEWEVEPGLVYDQQNLVFTNQVVTITGSAGANIIFGHQAGPTTVDSSTMDRNVIVGTLAGQGTTTNEGVAVGYRAGQTTQGDFSVAVGSFAGQSNQGSNSVAVGFNAGQADQGTNAIAIGSSAGVGSQSSGAIAVGLNSAVLSQGANSVAVGNSAGNLFQGASAVAVGPASGANSQGGSAIAVGNGAGNASQGASAVAVGNLAGQNSQGADGVAIGSSAGQNTQGEDAIAIGTGAGQTNQSDEAVALGLNAGGNSQGDSAIALGNGAGQNTQGADGVAIGRGAGGNTQGVRAIAIGLNSATTNQGDNAIAIGTSASPMNQGENAIAIGPNAGGGILGTQGDNAIALGSLAGFGNGMGVNSIAIGELCGFSTASANTIGLNASGSDLPLTNTNSFYVDPVADQTTSSATTSAIHYNTTTREVAYRDGVQENAENVLLNKDLIMNSVSNTLNRLGSSLTSWYAFDSQSNRLVDSGPSGNNLTEVGVSPLSYFDEVNGMTNVIQTSAVVHLENSPSLPSALANVDFTLTLWFNRETQTDITDYMLLYLDDTTLNISSSLQVYLDNDGTIAIFSVVTGALATSNAEYNDGAWHHLAVVITNTGLTAYVDGVDETSNFTIVGSDFHYKAVGNYRMAIGAFYSPIVVRPTDVHPYLANYTTSLGTLTADQVQTLFNGNCLDGAITLKGPIRINSVQGGLVAGYFRSEVTVIENTSDVTLNNTFSNNYILNTTTPINVFLPTTPEDGTELRFINVNTATITIDAGTNSFDGTVTTTQTLNQYDRLQVIYYSNEWYTF